MAKHKRWQDMVPDCAPYECHDAPDLKEAVWQAQLELDLIDEGQEAADYYTPQQVNQLRKFVRSNLALIKTMLS